MSSGVAIKPQGKDSSSVNKNVISLNSDKYFNDPDCVEEYEGYGFDVQPVDAFGAIVPKDKNFNREKTQANIRKRFQLDKPE